MPQFFTCLVASQTAEQPRQGRFWFDAELLVFADQHDETDYLNKLTYKVRRNSDDLLAHLRRIYFCYQSRLAEPLYAALVDLLIVLDGKGRAFSRRLILGCRSCLDDSRLKALTDAMATPRQLSGTHYSLFSDGLLGTSNLVEMNRQVRAQHDFLALANDFVEYSQLEQAMDTLEMGIAVSPERSELQVALLEIYQSTGNKERFRRQQQQLMTHGVALIDGWQLLEDFFNARVA